MIGVPPLERAEARHLLDSISTTTPAGLRDRALIALMVYTFVRIGAALAMKVEDVYTERRRLWVRPPGGVDVRLAGCCRRIRRGTAFTTRSSKPKGARPRGRLRLRGAPAGICSGEVRNRFRRDRALRGGLQPNVQLRLRPSCPRISEKPRAPPGQAQVPQAKAESAPSKTSRRKSSVHREG